MTNAEKKVIMYTDRMVYKVGDMVRVRRENKYHISNPRVPEHGIGLIVSIANDFYDVKCGQYIGKFHYSFLRSLSTKNCQGGIK